jgi:hypothetical protein
MQVSADGSAFPKFYAFIALWLLGAIGVGYAAWRVWRKK